MCLCVPLCASVCLGVPLCASVCASVCLCVPLCASVCLCVPLFVFVCLYVPLSRVSAERELSSRPEHTIVIIDYMFAVTVGYQQLAFEASTAV